MTPRLLKLSIPKSSLARRSDVLAWLGTIDAGDRLPQARCPADALRVATSYVLRDWQQWKGEDGTVYRAIAASPTEQKGLVLDVNVQARKADAVEYTAAICRITCSADEIPGFERKNREVMFHDLTNALDVGHLLTLGQDHLFE